LYEEFLSDTWYNHHPPSFYQIFQEIQRYIWRFIWRRAIIFPEVRNMRPYNVNAALGGVLRRYREGRGLAQDEFAELCGISRAYYGRIERGEHSPTVERCQLIASALNVRLADLFSELPE
jgi:DNA-binding XRE family transcriptional regulator